MQTISSAIMVSKLLQVYLLLHSSLLTVTNASASDKSAPTCFQSKEELQEAVYTFLVQNENRTNGPDTNLARKYGWPIGSWCVSNMTDFGYLFSESLFNEPLESWDMSNAQTTAGMFYENTYFDQNLSHWDMSSVMDMSGMFMNAMSFNGDVSKWDTSRVTNMAAMYTSAVNFNQDISKWDTSSVMDMSSMFQGATAFDSDLSSWNVARVNLMSEMFSDASNFSSDLSAWNVSSCEDMYGMFASTDIFNADLSSWDVSNVNSFAYMFSDAVAFNQDISAWALSSARRMDGMFQNTESFNQDLSGWEFPSSIQDIGSMFDGAESFHQNLCIWGHKLPASVNVDGMFLRSGCPRTSNPNFQNTPPGPFCDPCEPQPHPIDDPTSARRSTSPPQAVEDTQQSASDEIASSNDRARIGVFVLILFFGAVFILRRQQQLPAARLPYYNKLVNKKVENDSKNIHYMQFLEME